MCTSHLDQLSSEVCRNSKASHDYTLLYRYTIEEIKQMLQRLRRWNGDLGRWRANVETIFSQKQNFSDSIDLDDESDKIECKKPHVSQLLELLEEAKMSNYLEKKGQDNKTKVLYDKLDAELKTAMRCAEQCTLLIDLYKKNVKSEDTRTEEDSETAGNSEECEIIFIKQSPKFGLARKRIKIEQLKALMKKIDGLACVIEEQHSLKTIFNEALEQEIRIERLLLEWNLESPNQIKRMINYLDRVDIDFGTILVEQLRAMHRQSVWLNSVYSAVQNPAELSIGIIKAQIDRVIEEQLLVTFTDNPRSKIEVEKTFADLQELLSIAQTWDKKAKEQIESK